MANFTVSLIGMTLAGLAVLAFGSNKHDGSEKPDLYLLINIFNWVKY